MIRIRNLHVRYNTDQGTVHAVRGIDIDVERGQFYTLLGPSGCGKTTTLRCLAGLETPSEGEISIEGEVSAVIYMGGRGTGMPGRAGRRPAAAPAASVLAGGARPVDPAGDVRPRLPCPGALSLRIV